MMKRILLALMALLFTGAYAADEVPTSIKVLVVEQADQADLELSGSYRLFDPSTRKKVMTGYIKKHYPVQAVDSGIRWGEEFPGYYQLTVVPTTHSHALVNGVRYPGVLHIYQINNKISIVNEVSVEEYVKSCLSQESLHAHGEEVIAAIAIAARTHACFDAARGKEYYWHVKGADAGYVGYVPGQAPVAVENAVNETRGIIMNVARAPGKAFPAVWTENSAGHTASYQQMFRRGVGADLRGVEAPLAERDREIWAWSASIPKQELAAIAGLAAVDHVEVYKDAQSGKVYAVRVSDGPHAKDFSFFAFQELLGSDQVVSSEFSVEVRDSEVVFDGYGTGHGVGLCLYSADRLAERGRNAAQILGEFFPGTNMRMLRAEQAPVAERSPSAMRAPQKRARSQRQVAEREPTARGYAHRHDPS